MQKATLKTFKPLWLLWISISILIAACSPTHTPTSHTIEITEARLYSPDTTISIHTKLPATVYDALETAGVIPNPYVGENEEHVQWVVDKPWVYEMKFDLSQEDYDKENVLLIAKQLDTYCILMLNGEELFSNQSAFHPYKHPLHLYDAKLKVGTNVLEIYFFRRGEMENTFAEEYGIDLPEGKRVHTRKAQFQYGWDWGMKMKDIGVADKIEIIAYNGKKINEASVETKSLTAEKAELELKLKLHDFLKKGKKYIVQFAGSEHTYTSTGTESIHIPFVVEAPKLWQVHTEGEPYIYEDQLVLKDNEGQILDTKDIRYAIRTVELVQEELPKGRSFYFNINGKPVFAQGANIIPADHRYSRMSDEALKQLIDDAKAANMNMLRVWGGGFYLPESFYTYCDEQGMMVWQDFMFACAMYPDNKFFMDQVEKEAEYQLVRLRKHPSVVLWCGNNEVSEGWERWGWSNAYSEQDSTRVANAYNTLFRQLLPDTTARLTTNTPYWESSPSLGRGDSSYIYSGDAHNWWVWHDGAPFSNFEDEIPRFMSEFGFQSFPSLAAMDSMAKGNWPTAKELAVHQKHGRGFAIINAYWKRNLPPAQSREDSVYLTQVLQALGMEKGMRAHKTDAVCGGSLYWQLNDCWPVISWSSIDYYGYWKALHYRAAKAFDNNVLRLEQKGDSLHIYAFHKNFESADYTLYIADKGVYLDSISNLNQRKNTQGDLRGKVWSVDISKYELSTNSYFKIHATVNGSQGCHAILPVAAWKDFEFTPNSLEWRLSADGKAIEIEAHAFNAFVNIQTPIRKIEDNFFHMEAGEKRRIALPQALKKEDIKVVSLNQF